MKSMFLSQVPAPLAMLAAPLVPTAAKMSSESAARTRAQTRRFPGSECLLKTDTCASLAPCINTNGSFVCGEKQACTTCGAKPDVVQATVPVVSLAAATLNASTSSQRFLLSALCSDCPRSECLTNNGGCDSLTACNNTFGSFVCGAQ